MKQHKLCCNRPIAGQQLHGPPLSPRHAQGLPIAHRMQTLKPLSSTNPSSSSSSSSSSPDDGETGPKSKHSILDRFKAFLASSAREREKITSLGSAFVLSYGLVSNATYVTCLTLAWLSFVKMRGGLTPLDPGQWAPFLLYYGGLWTVQNFARPLRFAVAAGLAPGFDKAMDWLSRRLPDGWGKKAAFGILLAALACISTVGLCCGVYFGGGLPSVFPPLAR